MTKEEFIKKLRQIRDKAVSLDDELESLKKEYIESRTKYPLGKLMLASVRHIIDGKEKVSKCVVWIKKYLISSSGEIWTIYYVYDEKRHKRQEIQFTYKPSETTFEPYNEVPL